MGETENKAAQKESFFSGLSAEFKKIIWPDNKSLARQTAAGSRFQLVAERSAVGCQTDLHEDAV